MHLRKLTTVKGTCCDGKDTCYERLNNYMRQIVDIVMF
jgi:hypothetical protein